LVVSLIKEILEKLEKEIPACDLRLTSHVHTKLSPEVYMFKHYCESLNIVSLKPEFLSFFVSLEFTKK